MLTINHESATSMMLSRALLLMTLLVPLAASAQTVAPDVMRLGNDVYQARCAMCHDNPQAQMPSRAFITITNSADFVLHALDSGVMKQQAAGLSASEREAVATFLAGKPLRGASASVDINANRCAHQPRPLALGEADWNGWDGGQGSNLRYHRSSGLTASGVRRLRLKWAFALPGGASSQATVVGGRVFVPSMSGVVYSLDADTGCTLWAREIGAPVRSAIRLSRQSTGKISAYFGDMHGTVHALDAETGLELWRTRIDDHPAVRLTGSVAVFDGRVYAPVSSFEERTAQDSNYTCCTFRGSVVALDAATGKLLWKTYSIGAPLALLADGRRKGPAGGAIWSSPTVDVRRNLLYVGTGNGYTEPAAPETNAVIALDLKTGAKRWSRQLLGSDAYVSGCLGNSHINCPTRLGPDFDLGASPMLVTAPNGRQRLIVAAKSGVVFGLDPDDAGKILWETAAGSGGILGGIEWGAASDGSTVFVPVSDLGGRPLQGNAQTSPPMPGLNALSVASGALSWRVAAPQPVCSWGTPCQAAFHAAPTAIPGVVFSGALDGHARAYESRNGRLLWEFDTGRAFDAVNGGKAIGGSIDQGGQTISQGRLFVSSGARNGYPGNALLVFTVDGK